MAAKFDRRQEYLAWIAAQDWYQTMRLPSGASTQGSVPTDLRVPLLESCDFAGKRVLDIGCNSGQYCILAKAAGAREVIGIDLDTQRLEQARTLAANEGLEIDFRLLDLFDAPSLGRFDIVFCFAVLTEVPDLFGGIDVLRRVTSRNLILEIGLTRRALWLHLSPRGYWRRWRSGGRERRSIAEVAQTSAGTWVVRPTVELLRATLGPDFEVRREGPGVRYDTVVARRRSDE